MKFSKEEKEIILQKRKEEEFDRVKKVGFLKEDLYTFPASTNGYRYDLDDWIYSRTEMQTEVLKFSDEFELACKAGTQFDCYIGKEGSEEWYDTVGYGIEAMNEQWAQKYLKDIRPPNKRGK